MLFKQGQEKRAHIGVTSHFEKKKNYIGEKRSHPAMKETKYFEF